MRKINIMISISAITIITLALLGLTYAYFRTNVKGNENPVTIKTKVKKLAIEYSDGDAYMNMQGEIFPGFIALKNFSVENTGSDVATYSIILENINNTFDLYEDWEWQLYEGTYKNIDELNEAIETNNLEPIAPTESSNLKYIAKNTFQVLKGTNEIIAPQNGEQSIKYYTLKVEYKETGNDQSRDMNKEMSFKVNITDEWYMWDDAPEGSLLSKIKQNSNYVEPENLGTTANTTIPGRALSITNEAILSSSEDDFGTSYYFRGNVTNNYVNYAGMCWRIMRVQGDGSIKLVLEDQYAYCNDTEDTDGEETNDYKYTGNWQIPIYSGTRYGDFGIIAADPGTMTSSNGQTNTVSIRNINYVNFTDEKQSGSMASAFKIFQNKMNVRDLSLLSNTNWCIDDKAYKYENNKYEELSEQEIIDYKISATQFYYDSRKRLETELNPTFKCNGTIYNDWKDTKETPMYVSGMTASEFVFAGGKYYGSSTSGNGFYLLNDAFRNGQLTKNYFWTISPYSYRNYLDRGIVAQYNGGLSNSGASDGYAIRPVVALKSNVKVSDGSGIKDNPYVITPNE